MNNSIKTPATITTVKCAKGGKVQFEVSEAKGGVNVLVMFNASDDRFSQSATKAWLTGEPEDTKQLVPALAPFIDEVLKGGEGTKVECEIPAVAVNGLHLRVEINETLVPQDTYQEENMMKSIKINPSTQEVLLHGGNPIFRRTKVVADEPNDVRIKYDSTMSIAEFEAQLANAMTEASSTTVDEQVS